jgi:hypothetical protein
MLGAPLIPKNHLLKRVVQKLRCQCCNTSVLESPCEFICLGYNGKLLELPDVFPFLINQMMGLLLNEGRLCERCSGRMLIDHHD